jgi:hypothetical protein
MKCEWIKRTNSPVARPGKVHAPELPTINGPNRPICFYSVTQYEDWHNTSFFRAAHVERFDRSMETFQNKLAHRLQLEIPFN